MEQEPYVSIAVSTIRPRLWARFCESVKLACSMPYEIIFVGSIKDPSNYMRPDITFMYKDAPPVPCFELAHSLALGKFSIWAADDAIFRRGSIDCALKRWYSFPNSKTIVGFRYLETWDLGKTWIDFDYFQARKNWDMQVDLVQDSDVVAPFGLMLTDYYRSLGGRDLRFSWAMSENDVCLRAQRDGGRVVIDNDSWLDVFHELGDHKPMHEGHAKDRLLLRQKWSSV